LRLTPSASGRARAAARAAACLALVAAAALAQESAPASRGAASASRPADDLVRAENAARAALVAARGDDASARFPGATAGVAFADGRSFAVAVGWNDRERGVPMRPGDLLHGGSVGKTFVAAVALQAAAEGRFDLEAPLATWLGDRPWFPRLPNGGSARIRHLLQHRSGLVRYEFRPAFDAALRREPDRAWSPEELIAFVFDEPAPFAAGDRFEYSDTNYLVLGLALERALGAPLDDEIRRRVHRPLQLEGFVRARGRKIEGLAQGYPGRMKLFGAGETMLDAEGRLPFDPAFEGAGGGWVGDAASWARWARAAWSGGGFPLATAEAALDAKPAPALGRDVGYGLGVIVRKTPLGVARGHSGFFPGYLAEAWDYPERGFSVAVLLNTSDLRGGAFAIAQRTAEAIAAR